jgi:hypothetical protein
MKFTIPPLNPQYTHAYYNNTISNIAPYNFRSMPFYGFSKFCPVFIMVFGFSHFVCLLFPLPVTQFSFFQFKNSQIICWAFKPFIFIIFEDI